MANGSIFIKGRNDSLRTRIIYDSAAFTATTLGDVNFFATQGTKTPDRMEPLIDGRLPAGERMLVQRIAVQLSERVEVVDVADAIILRGAILSLTVNDGEGDPLKIRGHLDRFPAGGGAAHGVTTTADLALEGVSFTNGVPDRRAMFVLSPESPILLPENVTFRATINVPVVLTGLTNMRIFVYLEGLYKFALAG